MQGNLFCLYDDFDKAHRLVFLLHNKATVCLCAVIQSDFFFFFNGESLNVTIIWTEMLVVKLKSTLNTLLLSLPLACTYPQSWPLSAVTR